MKTYLDAKIRDFSERDVAHTLVIPGPEFCREDRGNSVIYRIPGVAIPNTPGYRLLLRSHFLREVIRQERPQVIEVGSPFLVPHLTRRATHGRAVPMLGFYHADLVRTYVDPYVGRWSPGLQEWIRGRAARFVRNVYAQFDLTLVASHSVARELEGLGIKNVVRVSLGVDLACFHPRRATPGLKEALGVPAGKLLAVFAGRLCPEKGLDVVVEAHARMDPATRPHLLLVGEGPSQPGFQAIADSRPDLTVQPFESDKLKLARIFASSDIYLGAGPGETFGLSVAEAMATGTPMVGVDSGAVPDRIRGSDSGELYQRGDPESVRSAILRLTRRVGPELRQRTRALALREYGWKRTFDALFRIYRALLSGEMAA